MSNQNTKKSSEIELALFNYMGKMGMDDFGRLNSSLYFYFVTNLQKKKKKDVCTLTAETPPSTPYEPVSF